MPPTATHIGRNAYEGIPVIHRSLLVPALAVLGACGVLPGGPEFSVTNEACEGPPVLFSATFTVTYAAEATIAPPIQADGSSEFELGSTIPVKIRVLDCEGERANSLAPSLSMALLDGSGEVAAEVTVIRSSREVDQGSTLSNDGNGQYLYTLSTALSGFTVPGDLTPGRYRVTISSPDDFADVTVEFTLR